MNGRPNRGKKNGFPNFSGVVWIDRKNFTFLFLIKKNSLKFSFILVDLLKIFDHLKIVIVR